MEKCEHRRVKGCRCGALRPPPINVTTPCLLMAPRKEPRSKLTSLFSPKAAGDELAAHIDLQNTEKQAYLAKQLTSLVSVSGSLQSVGAAGAPSEQVKDARSVESACERILSAFGIKDRDFRLEDALATSPTASILAFQVAQIVRPDRYYHSPIVDDESRDHVSAILGSIVILRDAARRAREQAEGEKGEGLGGARRIENWPLKEMAWHILRLYIELTCRPPGISKSSSTGKRGGPAIRFLDSALRWLGWNVKPNTAADLINELKKDEGLQEALDNPIFKSEKS